MTEAMKAFGSKFKRNGDETAYVTNIEGPAGEREEIDVTAHDSEDGFREFVPGLADGGEVTLELRFVPNKHEDLYNDYVDGETQDYTIEYPDGSKFEFDGFVTSFEPSAEFEAELTASVSIKVTGKPTLTLADTE